ncbi:hypothetical protein [Microvirga roseola]|uniref:hypothetical protein n=1 Tax=Microvirga roseola TaxID=2883126 RepID=UPI001E412EF6|nr:hypothetical protein [Microvirga roseola]
MLNFLIGLTWISSSIVLTLIHYLDLFGGVRSRRGLTVFLICAAAFLGLGYYMWAEQQKKAVSAGFESSQDRRDAEKSGFADAQAWKTEKLKRSFQEQK